MKTRSRIFEKAQQLYHRFSCKEASEVDDGEEEDVGMSVRDTLITALLCLPAGIAVGVEIIQEKWRASILRRDNSITRRLREPLVAMSDLPRFPSGEEDHFFQGTTPPVTGRLHFEWGTSESVVNANITAAEDYFYSAHSSPASNR